MLYRSTRGGSQPLQSAEAIKQGIAPDGGLFVPESEVKFTIDEIVSLKDLSYQEKAVKILSKYLTDYTIEEIRECVAGAYSAEKFDSKDVVPLYKLNDQVFIQELWHGPTCAFKDIALQLLPRLVVKALYKTNEDVEIVILVATSGDTGKAALEGFKDVDGTRIIVFFPYEGVSQIQRLQMITQEGKNVWSIAVKGNFDDTQSGVKEIFTDGSFNERLECRNFKFSSANSINWGRLVPQIVYYFSAYADLLKAGEINPGDKINVAVPTGNFGNILAAYYALKMGLPINRLICAANENNVLTDFIRTGIYDRNRAFHKTISPSMDILISSNLERLLFEMSGKDAVKVSGWMKQLKETGKYKIDESIHKEIKKLFWSDFSTENETTDAIADVFGEYSYLIDTHTAVGIDVYDKYVISTGDLTKTVIGSTASPFKFNESVAGAIAKADEIKGKDEFELLSFLSEKSGMDIPVGLQGLDDKKVLHTTVCEKGEMQKVVARILDL